MGQAGRDAVCGMREGEDVKKICCMCTKSVSKRSVRYCDYHLGYHDGYHAVFIKRRRLDPAFAAQEREAVKLRMRKLRAKRKAAA